ncbi:xanthine dehydrogenase family protein molybdopterin-binding subunit [Jannaschia seosinensis]|nr:xanthine dehydrogenase family protein molybdopterin-binding subunit [Jannaschia seosinensis]
MDAAQPPVLDRTVQGLLGTAMDRPDGPLKVTGTARYAAEALPENLVTGFLVRATITKGRVIGMKAEAVEAMPGVIRVMTGHPLLRNPAQGQAHQAPEQILPKVDYFGQPVALVVAETFEQARHAAQALVVTYEEEVAEVDPNAASQVDKPKASQLDQGDLEGAMRSSPVAIDTTYTTAPHSSAPMEPHASIAEWVDGRLQLRGSYQMLKHNVAELADSLGVDEARVRIHAPYVGGGFGSKLGIAPEAVAAAHAARELGRPVRVVMARDQVFEMTMRRTETTQRMRLACDADGLMTALAHEDRVSNLPGEAFSEPTAQGTHFLYGGANRRFTHEVARIHRPCAGSVRAPGEAVGMIALECAMDELAEAADIDPVELRIRNIPDTTPEGGQPYSERALERCLREGAERFGWSQRRGMAERLEGDWWVGMGVAAAVRTNMMEESIARVTLRPDGTALCETDMTDIGTGSYAILTQIVGEMLGLPREKVEVQIGDSDLPKSSGSGGSFGAQSCGSAVFLACQGVRKHLAERMEVAPDDLTLRDGRATGGNRQVALTDLVEAPMSAEGHVKPGETEDNFSIAGYGAHFAEVGVHRDTGEVRVHRMLGVFSIGRVLNMKTATSQCHGGMIWGIGSALTEEIMHDPRDGRIVNHNLAEYHIPVSLDVPQLDAMLLEDTRDDQANPIQAKGIGELGISGAAAAVGNAIRNACGVRVRDFPATPDKIFPHLPDVT